MFEAKKAPVIDCCDDLERHPNDPICQKLVKRGGFPREACLDPVIDQDGSPADAETPQPLPDWLFELLVKLRDAENPTTNEYRIFADGLENEGMSREAKALTKYVLRESLDQATPASEDDLVAFGQVAVCHAQACRSLDNAEQEQVSRNIAVQYLTASHLKASGGSTTAIKNMVQVAQDLIKNLDK